jgi:hypothetical protein
MTTVLLGSAEMGEMGVVHVLLLDAVRVGCGRAGLASRVAFGLWMGEREVARLLE